MSNGAKEITNTGKYAVLNPPVQFFVLLAQTNTVQALTAATDVYFQKLWIYPGATATGSKINVNAGSVYVGKKGQKLNAVTVTLSVAKQTVTVAAASHGLTVGTVVTMSISGATPAQYNGTWQATVVDANTLSYTLANEPVDTAVTGTVVMEYYTALTVTPDALAPSDLPLKYELPLGQKMRLSDIVVQGAANDGVFVSVW